MGFENGIYDLDNHLFRSGHPEDNVSKSVGYDYVVYDTEDLLMKELLTIVSDLFQNPQDEEYMWNIVCNILSGSSYYKKYYKQVKKRYEVKRHIQSFDAFINAFK